ncbi:hypothetical protein OG474_31270 [Kribbella sp. NBC_01505]|uniref:hypothetical protein n=1 Tax=Kribbella sp. NBC_01505 TaxID=2903580 RepID=UPI00386C2A99
MTNAVVTALREIANRDLYQRNAFHVTNLNTSVDRRTTRRRQQHVIAVLEAGADLETTGSTDPDELRLAFDRLLGDPRRRLVDEVFGEWGRPDGECGCDTPVHQAHDEAVYAHASAIELLITAPPPPTSPQPPVRASWERAAERWTAALQDPQFWQHLRNRVLALDDWQLAASAVDQIRSELPRALTGPLLDLAASGDYTDRTARMLQQWQIPGTQTEQWVLDTLRPQYERTEDAVVQLLRRQQNSPDEVDGVIAELERSVLPSYRRLQVLLPSVAFQRTLTLRDDIALVYHNGAVEIVNHIGTDPRVGPWLRQAEGYAAGAEMQAKLAETAQVYTLMDLAKDRPAAQQKANADAEGCGCLIFGLVILAVVIYVLIKVLS